MRAELTVKGETFDEIWTEARARFAKFFGEHQPKIEALEARPDIEVRRINGAVTYGSWEIDFEARL